MNKAQALNLIGHRVDVWTSANGCYVGTLKEIVAEKGRPWRGRVLIDGILAPAQHFERGSACRRGFRVGEVIEAGGVNIHPTEATGAQDYLIILEAAMKACREQVIKMKGSPHIWATRCFADAYEAAIEVERERLQTGIWDSRKLNTLYRGKSSRGDISEE